MRNTMDLRGKRVLVTGGASGIGLATAREFAQRQAVPILVDVNSVALESEIAAFREQGYEMHGYAVDITSIEAVRDLQKVLEYEGLSPDVLVNCAGLTLICHVSTMDYEDWTSMIGVNVMGTINMIHTFMQPMISRGYGHIANVGSIDGIIPIPGQTAYCASKFAITGLTETLYFDLRQCGVGVSLVCPGYVNTPMAQAMPVRDMQFEFKGIGLAMRLVATFSNSPKRIARHIAHAVAHDKFLVIPGFPSRMFYHFRRLMPRVATNAGVGTARVFEKMRERLGTD